MNFDCTGHQGHNITHSWFAAFPIGGKRICIWQSLQYLGDDERPLYEILNIMYSVAISVQSQHLVEVPGPPLHSPSPLHHHLLHPRAGQEAGSAV